MTETAVIVHATPELLADAAAARLVVQLSDAQAARGSASVVLTGGRIAGQLYQAVRALPARDAVDWSRVEFWWGDERFLPAGHPERNETLARSELLDWLALDPVRVHPMYPSDGPDGDDPDAAAARYAEELARAARPDSAPLPHFDVVLLGVGEEGHVASVFPDAPAASDTRTVTAVRDCPKPPPTRITLTVPAINTAAEVWLIAAGAEKAGAVGKALAGPGGGLPAGSVRGTARTLWLLDSAAAAMSGSESPQLARGSRPEAPPAR